MSFWDLFKKPVTTPLPDYTTIEINAIPPASALLFYGGTWLTELAGNRMYRYPYKPPAFHAAFYIEDGLFLNVGAFKTIEQIESHLQTTRRVDVVIYKDTPQADRQKLLERAYTDTSKPKIGFSLPDYDWKGYLHFGIKWFKPFGSKDFCSENVVELFETAGVKVSANEPSETAPWDLQLYAEANPETCEIRTVYVGPDFKK